jgi:predicted enzyme related to lactoylglutathione lyase
MAKILGIGGIFFKSKDDQQNLLNWYDSKLGINPHWPGGHAFSWQLPASEDGANVEEHSTIWSIFKKGNDYFKNPDQQFMINYIVDDLEGYVADLVSKGVEIDPERNSSEYGDFAWVHDPEGNRIELWQPPIKKPDVSID